MRVGADRRLVVRATGGEAVGEIAAGQALAMRAVAFRAIDLVEISLTCRAAALGDACGDLGDDGIQWHIFTLFFDWLPRRF